MKKPSTYLSDSSVHITRIDDISIIKLLISIGSNEKNNLKLKSRSEELQLKSIKKTVFRSGLDILD